MDDQALRAEVTRLRDSGDTHEHYNALPHTIVLAHGARGYAALMSLYASEEGVTESFFDVTGTDTGAVPAECPFPRGLAPTALVDRIFAPIATEIPTFVVALRSNVRAVLALHRRGGKPSNRGWFLLYFLDRAATVLEGNNRYSSLAGRAPMRRPRLNGRTRNAGFTLPPSLRRLYNVHNGLGFARDSTSGVESLLSAKLIAPLPCVPELLEVFCDSGGNRKCFPRGEDRIVDWDRSTDERANEGSLWTLLDRDLVHYVRGDQ